MTQISQIAPGSVGYFFCNHYMQGIHGGIQSLHAAVELALDYPPGTPGFEVFQAWGRSGAANAVLLNGGYQSRLEAIARAIEAFNREANEGIILPYARFREGQDELNGTLTAVALIIPGQWMTRDFTRSREEVEEVLAMGDPVEVAVHLKHWAMADRLRLVRHGMPLRT